MATVTSEASMGAKVRRGLIWSTASNIVLRLANLASGIVMARLIAPEAFGVFAVALTAWSILSSVAEFGLGADLVRRDDYQRFIPTIATLGLAISASLALVMFMSAPVIAATFGSPGATSIVQLMSVSLLMIGLSVVPAALLQRSLRQGALFAIDASSTVTGTVVMVILALSGLGPLALALGRISGQAVGLILQYMAVHRWPVLGWDRSLARDVLGFGLPLALANAISWSIISVDNLVVARSLGPLELGLYVLAFNLASWPMSVAGQSIRVVALPAFSRLSTSEDRGLAMVKIGGPVWAISLPVALGLIFFAPHLIEGLYGQPWVGAVEAVIPLAAFGALRVIFDLSATYLIACGKSRSVLVVQLIWLSALIPALNLGIERGGLAGAGWAHVGVAFLVVLPAYLIAMRRSGVAISKFMRAWLTPTATAIPLAGTLWLTAQALPTLVPAILAGGIIGTLIYVAPLCRWWATRIRSLNDVGTKIDNSSLVL